MYAACFVFLMLWLAHLWAWKGSPPTGDGDVSIRVDAPMRRADCGREDVPCVDDCSFLCLGKGYECIGGTCRSVEGVRGVACDGEKGIRMMVHEPRPAWTCVCKDARFYGGEGCDVLNPGVCENGAFAYVSESRFLCVCSPPYELINVDSKPHCVEKKWMGFYDERSMDRNRLGA